MSTSSTPPWRPEHATSAIGAGVAELWQAAREGAQLRRRTFQPMTPHQAICAADALRGLGPVIAIPTRRVSEAWREAKRDGRSRAELLSVFEPSRPSPLPSSVFFVLGGPGGGPATVEVGGVVLPVPGALVTSPTGRARTCTPYGNFSARPTGGGPGVARGWILGNWPHRAMPPLAPLGRFVAPWPGDGPRDPDAMPGARSLTIRPDAFGAPGLSAAIQLGPYDAARLGLGPRESAETKAMLAVWGAFVARQVELVAAVASMFAEGRWLVPQDAPDAGA
jgi:hypothetical protein